VTVDVGDVTVMADGFVLTFDVTDNVPVIVNDAVALCTTADGSEPYSRPQSPYVGPWSP
jgi:hypothetical protein